MKKYIKKTLNNLCIVTPLPKREEIKFKSNSLELRMLQVMGIALGGLAKNYIKMMIPITGDILIHNILNGKVEKSFPITNTLVKAGFYLQKYYLAYLLANQYLINS